MMTKTKSSKWAKFKLIFAIPIIIIGLVAFTKADLNLPSQEKSQSSKSNTNIENQPVGMAFIPQGTFILKREDGNKIKDLNVSIEAFWMRENEVTVKEYLEFTESIKKDSAKNVYEATLPNRNKVPFNDYYTNIKYYNFPMVGVTLHQAQNYCLWITAKMNLELKKQGKPLVYSSRLPAEAEWIYASFGGLNPDKIVKPQITFLTKIGSKKPNEWGLNNMFDNVSEWTNTSFDPEKYMTEVQYFSPLQINKIIVKGNNYKNLATNDMLILDGNDSYDYVGFRYVRSYSSEN